MDRITNEESSTILPETDKTAILHPLKRIDWTIAVGLAMAVFLGLFVEIDAPGVTWDEGLIQFPVAKNQAKWIRDFFSLDAPLSQETIDAYWYTKSDHPSPPRTLAAISYLLLNGWVDEIVALRLPSAVVFSILTGSIFLLLRLFLPRMASLAGGISLALMPCVFGHAHIFSLDVPMMAWWFWAAVCGFLVYHGRCKPIWFGLAYALAFSTKLHAVFLPVPLLIWMGWMRFVHSEYNRTYWQRPLWGAVWAAVLSPVLYIGLQPWLWHDTMHRIVNRFFHYAAKTPIPVYYLGTVYGESNPWHYPFVIVLFTIPAIILLYILLGIFSPFAEKQRSSDEKSPPVSFETKSAYPFLILLFIAPLLVIQLSKAYDGCRLILPCFPFAACLAGFGYHVFGTIARKRLNGIIVHVLLMALLIAPSIYTYAKIRPFYLSYYNELIGGVSGAWRRGLETAFWCDALTRDFLLEINRIVPEGKTIKPASMAFEVYEYYRQRGWVRPAIADPADYYLLQSRQGMWRRDETYLFFREKPLATVELDGVQLFGLYKAPTR